MVAQHVHPEGEQDTPLFADRERADLRRIVLEGGLRPVDRGGGGVSTGFSERQAVFGEPLRHAGVLSGVGWWRYLDQLAPPLARHAANANVGSARNPHGPAVRLWDGSCPKVLPSWSDLSEASRSGVSCLLAGAGGASVRKPSLPTGDSNAARLY